MIGIDDGIDDGWELMEHGGGCLAGNGQRQTSLEERRGREGKAECQAEARWAEREARWRRQGGEVWRKRRPARGEV